jgi:predicted ATPase
VSHPLLGYRFKFLDFKSFDETADDWIEFDQTTLIVGRNNVGKSGVVHALRVVLENGKSFTPDYNRFGRPARIHIAQKLVESDLRATFPEGTSGGPIGSDYWRFGQRFIGSEVVREFDGSWRPHWNVQPEFGLRTDETRFLTGILKAIRSPQGRFFHIAPERDVRPEPKAEAEPVRPDGSGLTNLVRAFLYDSRLPMHEVEDGLLEDLNEIYRGDTQFDRILCREDANSDWEIFLTESGSYPVRLSQSGSCINSLFIILPSLRINPIIDGKHALDKCVFCIEEPENNLHPTLLRRLLDFLVKKIGSEQAALILTTHSGVAIDWGTRRKNTSTYHVRRIEDASRVFAVQEYRATRDLINDLDIRASEILQANGVVWVEGPTDRTYINNWINLLTDGKLIEGDHYSVMYYGGKLLSHLNCLAPDEATKSIQLLRMNRNFAVVIDSDKRKLPSGKTRSDLNATKKRIIQETMDSDGLVWVTQGKEIENYISSRLIKMVSNDEDKNVDKFESVPDALTRADKISLAHNVAELSEDQDLDHLDLRARVTELVDRIRLWNSLEK